MNWWNKAWVAGGIWLVCTERVFRTHMDNDVPNTLRPRQNGHHFADGIFKCIFLNENVWTSNKISLKLVPNRLINIIPALVQKMAWHRLGDKPLPEPMVVSSPAHICVTQPQCINAFKPKQNDHFRDDILKYISLMKQFEFRLKFRINSLINVQLKIGQYCLRWLGNGQVTSLNQCSMMLSDITMPQRVSIQMANLLFL